MKYVASFTFLWLAAWPALLGAEELRILPPDCSLVGNGQSQRLLVVRQSNGAVTGDATGDADFSSSDRAVATVDPRGVVRAVSDGEAVITAVCDGAKISTKVKVSGTKEVRPVSFRNEVIPILTKIGCNSGACHGALAGKGGMKLSLRGFAPATDHFVITQQAQARRVNLPEPARSLFLLKPSAAIAHGGGQKLSVDSPDFRILADWLATGAPGPQDDDPRIQRIEVLPPAAVLKPKDSLQLVVRAWYSDGRSVDVTRWAKFNSTEDLVAAVDPTGEVTVTGRGEAAVTAWFSNQVAVARVTVPFAEPIDRQRFQASPRKNFIDGHVLKKLEVLRIPPSEVCTDAEFLRRLYLDAAGILPAPEELHTFLSDPSAEKRSKWIDTLLDRPEYVDYWTYKWSDLLLVSSRRLQQPALWSFHRFIRQSVADNKPWDRFARDVLTASGSNLQNGAANFFVLHTDVAELSEATSLTFLGTSITCARCHNHPLEKWTQDQYWSMANLFARVARKNGDRAGEILVQAQPSGDVLHPRRGVPMPPAPLDGKPLPLESPDDRRDAFADWLTNPENPYFARAIVNRVWRNFMGRGLVEAEDDFRQTNPPSNPELLDALATDFVAHGYDMKRLVRTIVESAAYQRSSRTVPGNENDDRFCSHYLVRRLPAEVILDAYSSVTGVSTSFTGYPAGTRAMMLPDSLVASGFLDSFGRPPREQTCSCERQQDATVTQALHLNNGQTLNDKLRDKDSRARLWSKEKASDDELVKRLFALALSREPTAAEAKKFTSLLGEAASNKQAARDELLEDMFWAVLTSREFLFNR
jgi:hypothetical protein